ENGQEGLEIFNREKPAVVLTDIKMPGMNGIEVLKRIKALDPATQVIVITGHGDMDLAIQALNLDAADFINKPVQRELLEQALARARERHGRLSETSAEARLEAAAAVIRISGIVNAAAEEQMQAVFREALALGQPRIVLQFAENTDVNGAGIAVLTQLILEGRRQGREVAMVGLSDNLRKVFELVGLTGMAADGQAG
ncbi:MAG TPA: response regulator, partial [Bryobacteraceae bacterium]|nr:response regulator [Bryobacteraceae bacterium]